MSTSWSHAVVDREVHGGQVREAGVFGVADPFLGAAPTAV